MKRQQRRNTLPELAVRRVLGRLGLRYRLENRDLPGSPDVANRRGRWAIFVHGCYWHAHEGCPRHTIPKRNRDFWIAKFADNKARDIRAILDLEALGYRTLQIWECETKSEEAIKDSIRAWFDQGSAPDSGMDPSDQ